MDAGVQASVMDDRIARVACHEQNFEARPQADRLVGKPAPDTYLAAARALGVVPAEAAVFEDALSGVEAGRAGAFGFVVGVDRVGQTDALRLHGADTVVTDLTELLRGS